MVTLIKFDEGLTNEDYNAVFDLHLPGLNPVRGKHAIITHEELKEFLGRDYRNFYTSGGREVDDSDSYLERLYAVVEALIERKLGYKEIADQISDKAQRYQELINEVELVASYMKVKVPYRKHAAPGGEVIKYQSAAEFGRDMLAGICAKYSPYLRQVQP